MIQNKHKGCIQNARSFRATDVDPDHYLVRAKFIIRLCKNFFFSKTLLYSSYWKPIIIYARKTQYTKKLDYNGQAMFEKKYGEILSV